MTMIDDASMQFAPFVAINDFMLSDFRLNVIQDVFSKLSDLPESIRQQLDTLSRAGIVVPGFRNSAKAPARLKAKHATAVFEKSSEFVGLILQAWAYLHHELGEFIFTVLTELGWEVFPLDVDRLKMPGFIPQWPDTHDFSSINKLFDEKFPGKNFTNDQISLMIVWVSLRLPYDQDDSSNVVV